MARVERARSRLVGRRAAVRPGRIIEPYERVPVVVRSADPVAPVVARRLLELIATVVPGSRTEHVGSSAVPGLAGKGTIDLLLPTQSERIPAVTEALLGIGFQRQSFPPTFPPSRPMLQGVFRHQGRPYRVHLHIVPASSREVRELRAFRDALRTDARLRHDYEKLKRDIVARGLTEATAFTQAKHSFIVGTLRRLGLRAADGG